MADAHTHGNLVTPLGRRRVGGMIATLGLILALLAGGVAYASGSQSAPIDDGDVLDMSGDWILTYGYTAGMWLVDGHNAPNPPTSRTFEVRLDVEGPSAHGVMFSGYYKGFEGHPLGPPGALSGETFYAGRGVTAVQLVEKGEAMLHFALLSGTHKVYSTEPDRTEIAGGWADIGGYVANFTLVKMPGSR